MNEIEGIPGAFLASPNVHGDERGSFLEIFREDLLETRFVQANHSHSQARVLRGLHYHLNQSDAWYVISGEAQVGLADLRTGNENPPVRTINLSSESPQVLLIPPRVAHGFLAVTDVDLIYWVTHYYDASDEFGVAWDDPTLAIAWKISDPILSDRDKTNPKFEWDSVSPS